MNIEASQADPASDSQRILEFVLWALKALEQDVTPGDEGCYLVDLPVDDPQSGESVEPVCFSLHAPQKGAATEDMPGTAARFEHLTPRGRLLTWVIDRLAAQGPLHAAPASQPDRVHQLTPHLFDRYTVDGGRVQLAGCRLEDRPFVRLTFLDRSEDEGCRLLPDVFLTGDGKVADEALVAALGLNDLRPLKRPPGPPPQLDPLIAAAQQRVSSASHGASTTPVAVVVAWCKYAQIKLSFLVSEQSAYLDFSGWAQMIVDGLIELPPYTCPETGVRSYSLASTDDGRVTAAEAIAACEQTGRRVLTSDLVTCAATQQRVLASRTANCPVSGQHVVRSALSACSVCQQEVSPTVLRGGKCAACRNLTSVTKADPRMARVLSEHAGLDGWRRWRISETARVYVLVATTLWRRLLVVVDKETLEPLRVAVGGRLGSNWTDLQPLPREEILR